jgi:hypothetical protein
MGIRVKVRRAIVSALVLTWALFCGTSVLPDLGAASYALLAK